MCKARTSSTPKPKNMFIVLFIFFGNLKECAIGMFVTTTKEYLVVLFFVVDVVLWILLLLNTSLRQGKDQRNRCYFIF